MSAGAVLHRRALQPVCKTWAAVGATCGALVTSATIDAEEYAQRRGRPLDWRAACTWLQQRLGTRPTLSLRCGVFAVVRHRGPTQVQHFCSGGWPSIGGQQQHAGPSGLASALAMPQFAQQHSDGPLAQWRMPICSVLSPSRLTSGHHTMPAGGLFAALPAFAGTLRTLHLHLRSPGLTSRDIVGLGRLTELRALHMDVQTTAEVSHHELLHPAFAFLPLSGNAESSGTRRCRLTGVPVAVSLTFCWRASKAAFCASLQHTFRILQVLVIGLQELQPLSRLTNLSIDAVVPPIVPGDCCRYVTSLNVGSGGSVAAPWQPHSVINGEIPFSVRASADGLHAEQLEWAGQSRIILWSRPPHDVLCMTHSSCAEQPAGSDEVLTPNHAESALHIHNAVHSFNCAFPDVQSSQHGRTISRRPTTQSSTPRARCMRPSAWTCLACRA